MGWAAGMPAFLTWFRPSYHSGGFSSRDLQKTIIPSLLGAITEGGGKVLHPHILAFGLILREIDAAIKTRNGEDVKPPMPVAGVGSDDEPSNLDDEDLDFVNSKLEALLQKAGNPKYVGEARPKRSLRAKKEGKA